METYTLGYKFRIYPNATQARLIHRTLGCARFVYNHFLAVRRDQWNANLRSRQHGIAGSPAQPRPCIPEFLR